MSFQDNLRSLASQVRGIAADFGVRPYSVQIKAESWDGDERGEGSSTTTLTSITEAGGANPKVRWLSSQEVAIGGFEDGSVEVGPITPDHPGGGTSLSALLPTLGNNATRTAVVTGPRFPSGAEFRIAEVKHDRGYQYRLVLQPIGR